MKILVADDSIIMRNIHKNVLLQHNVPEEAILEAKDGDLAFITAKKEDIDLFLLDWNMPGLSGLEFTKKMRALDKYKDTPIVMVTSQAAKYNVMEAIEAGVTSYIVKPIKPEILWSKIAQYIEK